MVHAAWSLVDREHTLLPWHPAGNALGLESYRTQGTHHIFILSFILSYSSCPQPPPSLLLGLLWLQDCCNKHGAAGVAEAGEYSTPSQLHGNQGMGTLLAIEGLHGW